VRCIGAGTCGEVCLVADRATGREYAPEQINRDVAGDYKRIWLRQITIHANL
jgi:hypothetical protein